MTRPEAEQRCSDLLAVCGPDVHWMPRKTSSGEWTVVRLHVPGLPPGLNGPVTTAQESRPRPGPADTRPLVNPYWSPG
jgi:hypothetical protein